MNTKNMIIIGESGVGKKTVYDALLKQLENMKVVVNVEPFQAPTIDDLKVGKLFCTESILKPHQTRIGERSTMKNFVAENSKRRRRKRK